MLTRENRKRMSEILNITGEPPEMSEALGLMVKMMALHITLLDAVVDELSGIERCLERISAK